MDLKEEFFILIDFQTSGTKADDCYIIEAGWGLYRASELPESVAWNNHLISLPPGVNLPLRIQRLTGIPVHSEDPCISFQELGLQLVQFIENYANVPILFHYARFKQPFLKQILVDQGLDPSAIGERVICTYQLAKSVLPQLKSYSLRAVAGYADYSLGDKKRTKEHLLATAYAWRYLENEIILATDWNRENLPKILSEYRPLATKTAKATLYAEELRAKRLALPMQPGVYFFVDRSDRILYVGKARQLKARVNSYFRGKKTKGSRLNEMLTRAADLRVQICKNELEALLEESDAIKRHNPPYNILLTQTARGVHWLSPQPWLAAPWTWGPLSSLWTWRALEAFMETSSIPGSRSSLLNRLLGKKGAIDAWLDDALSHFFLQYGLVTVGEAEPELDELPEKIFSLGQKLWKDLKDDRVARLLESHSTSESQALAGTEEQEGIGSETLEIGETAKVERDLNAEDIREILRKILEQLAYQIHRGRWLVRLVESEISWQFSEQREQIFRVSSLHGVISIEEVDSSETIHVPPAYGQGRKARNDFINLACLDRISILYSALRRGLQRGDRIQLCLRPGLILDDTDLRSQII